MSRQLNPMLLNGPCSRRSFQAIDSGGQQEGALAPGQQQGDQDDHRGLADDVEDERGEALQLLGNGRDWGSGRGQLLARMADFWGFGAFSGRTELTQSRCPIENENTLNY